MGILEPIPYRGSGEMGIRKEMWPSAELDLEDIRVISWELECHMEDQSPRDKV